MKASYFSNNESELFKFQVMKVNSSICK
jgi:hypothetical protein